jgi:hypothetical protein
MDPAKEKESDRIYLSHSEEAKNIVSELSHRLPILSVNGIGDGASCSMGVN